MVVGGVGGLAVGAGQHAGGRRHRARGWSSLSWIRPHAERHGRNTNVGAVGASHIEEKQVGGWVSGGEWVACGSVWVQRVAKWRCAMLLLAFRLSVQAIGSVCGAVADTLPVSTTVVRVSVTGAPLVASLPTPNATPPQGKRAVSTAWATPSWNPCQCPPLFSLTEARPIVVMRALQTSERQPAKQTVN